MVELPSGTVTFFFTDIEGSTTRWEQHPEAMRAALAHHDALLHDGIAAHGGTVVVERGEGDSFFALFARPSDALSAACAVQQTLAAEPWPQEVAPLRVRMALHTGEAGLWEGRDYRGAAVNRCARLRAVAHGGQVLLSGATSELVRDQLPPGVTLRDLGEHRLKDLTRPEHIYQVVQPDLPADFPPLKTLDRQRHNLLVQPTTLIGREREVQEVRQHLLEPDTRLLTLTGPGGTGKTRLALQVAAEVLEDFSDGVFFVNLAPLTDPALVLPTIAQTLGVLESGSQPLRDTLHAFFQEKQVLLVLDNFEQVVDAASVVADLLAACAPVRALVTSRAALHLRGERIYPVPPLKLPALAPLPLLERLTQYEAVRLFIERARDVKPDFAMTNETAPAVAEICARLDGLPLAIELAAARVRLFTPPALLARLSNRLEVLTGGARDLPERQRTLRATLDWSYSLLTEAEQTLFARLGVFVGGCTLEAIEVVCNVEGDLDVLACVESLLEKSLLGQVEAEGETRFAMLETIHEYARERLEASGEAETIRQAHAAYFLALAVEAESGLKGPEQGAWLARLEWEHDNLRTALRWAQESGAVEIGLRLAGALREFWDLQGCWSEGRRWLNALLEQHGANWSLVASSAQESRTRIGALNAAALLAAEQNDYEPARALADASAALARSIGDVPGLIDALGVLGMEAYYHRMAQDEVRDLDTQRVDLARAFGDGQRTARALHALAITVFEDGDLARAGTLWEESDRLYRACGDPAGRAAMLCWRGLLAWAVGDIAHAVQHAQDALSLAGATRLSGIRAAALGDLAEFRIHQGMYGEAEVLLAEAHSIHQTTGASFWTVLCNTQLGRLALMQGRLERAETLLDESVRLAQDDGAVFEVVRARIAQGDVLTYREQYDRADEVYQEALHLVEPMHARMAMAEGLRSYGILAQRQGRYALALECFYQALALLPHDERRLRASVLTALARTTIEEGDSSEAGRLFYESLDMERSMGRPRGFAEALEGLAAVAMAQGETEQAVRMSAAAAGIRASIGAPLSPYERAAFERTLVAAREAVGAATVDAVWADAQAVPWERIVDEVLADG